MNVKFTGERLIPNLPELTFLYQEHIVRYLFASQFVRSKVVLDAACGTGYGSSLLLDKGAKKVIGVDISKDAIDYCNQNYKKENLEYLLPLLLHFFLVYILQVSLDMIDKKFLHVRNIFPVNLEILLLCIL